MHINVALINFTIEKTFTVGTRKNNSYNLNNNSLSDKSADTHKVITINYK